MVCALDLELWNPLKKCVTLLCNISVNWCFNKCALDPSRCKCPLNISSEDLPPTGYPFSMNFWKLWEQPRESYTKWPDTVLSLVCFSRNSRSPSHSSKTIPGLKNSLFCNLYVRTIHRIKLCYSLGFSRWGDSMDRIYCSYRYTL